MDLIQNPDGKHRLHIWRTGTAFEFSQRFHLYDEWNNIKFATLKYPDKPPFLLHLDVRGPIPYADNTFNVVYCNHVIEHLTPDEGLYHVQELYRVTEPGGICRMVVPDLELSANEYIECLNNVASNRTEDNIRRYKWAVADLIDQMVRPNSGGEMWKLLASGDVDWEQIKRCNGDVFEEIRTGAYFKKLEEKAATDSAPHTVKRISNDLTTKIKNKFYRYLKTRFGVSPKPYVEQLNERTMWMYDRYSLPELIKKGGFGGVHLVSYKTSDIHDWQKYDFDRADLGDHPLEPSVYAEGVK